MLVESRTMGFGIWNTALRIGNLTNDWNPESKFHQQGTGIAGLKSRTHGMKSGMQVPPTRDWNCRPGIQNAWCEIRNPRQSWIPLHGVIGYNDKT